MVNPENQVVRDESPECPNCGAEWVQSGPRCIVDGPLQEFSRDVAAEKYHMNPEEYDDTGVLEFECGNVIEEAEFNWAKNQD